MHPASYFRHCPRCGHAVEGSVGARPFRCAACGFLLYFNPAVSAAAIVLGPDDRVLFIRRAHDPARGMLALVGGFVDAGESVEDALAREVREEVNLEIASARYLGSFPNPYVYQDVEYPVADLVFVCRVARPDEALPLDGVMSVHWLDPREVDPAEVAFPSMRAALALYLRS